jgi:hypothetical protein
MPRSLDQTCEAFRLNLEQQKKRAKDLCHAARRGDSAAVARINACLVGNGRVPAANPATLKLADAQWVIARELGMASWAKLGSHIAAMKRELAAIGTRVAPDQGPKTLHIRCGSDIAEGLRQAGFIGDFLEYSNPFCQGPVTGEPDHPDQINSRARFLATSYGGILGFSISQCADKLRQEESRLAAAAGDYERVVLWLEHDSYDQLILIRCLSHFATRSPRVLELASANRFPGSLRFIGLGQLPPEALRLVWTSRKRVSQEQLTLGRDAWEALKSSDPTGLAVLAHDRSSELPDLPMALRRHLQELPSVRNGLGLTEEIILTILAQGSQTIGGMYRRLMTDRDPLPWLGDVMFFHRVVEVMRKACRQVLEVLPGTVSEAWPRQHLSISPTGFQVLSGKIDWLALAPPERWVGGVCITPRARTWRWDKEEGRPVFF